MRKISDLIIALLVSGLTLFLTGCPAAAPSPAPGAEYIDVVTTIFPLADIVLELGGEKAAVTGLLPVGASPHDFEPAVGQIKAVSQASLFVYMGGGLDDWAAPAARSEAGEILMLELYEAALAQGWQPPPGLPAGSSAEPAHGALNPHLWLDPLTVRDYLCPAITGALVEADGKNEAYYRSRLAAYQAALTDLDAGLRAELSALPQKSFVSLHAAWHYFADRYGLDEAAVITDFPGQEPSAAALGSLVDFCRERGITVVSAEPQFPEQIADTIAREIGGRVVLLDPLGGGGLEGRESYLDLMRYNAAVLKDALSK